MKFNFYIFIFLLIVPLINADVVIDTNNVLSIQGISIQGVDITQRSFNFSVLNVTSAKFWDTEDRGPLRNVADIRHDWLDIISLLMGNSGHIFNVDLDMMEFNITNVTNIILEDKVCLDENCELFMKRNDEGNPFNGISLDAIWFSHEEISTEGDIAFLGTQENETLFWWQVGSNNSYSGTGNTFGVIPNYWGTENFTEVDNKINMTKLSDYLTICDTFGSDFFSNGDVCRFSADTRGRGMPLLFTGDLEVWRQSVFHQGVLSFGDAEFIMNGFNFDIVNGSLHPRTTRIETVGFILNDNVTTFNVNFDSGSLSPFIQVTGGGAVDWTVESDPSCHQDLCARALGGSGSPLRLMEANFSAFELDNLNLSFWITSVISGSDNLSVDVNNNEGSGNVTIFTTSSSLSDVLQTFILPVSMNNKSAVTIRVSFTGNNPIADIVFIDEITVNANATGNTQANLTRFDTEILLGEGLFRIFWNGSTNTLSLPGNITVENIVNLTTQSINLRGETITNWDNVSDFDNNVLLRNGSRTLTANWNIGAFSINGGGDIFLSGVGSFSNGLVTTANNLILDIDNEQLFDSSGAGVLLFDGQRMLQDTSNSNSIDFDFRVLYDNIGNEAISYNNRILTDETGAFSVDFTSNRFLADSGGTDVLNWANLVMTGNWDVDGDFTAGTIISDGLIAGSTLQTGMIIDIGSGGQNTIDVDNGQLFANGGSDVILDFNTVGLANFNDSDIQTTGTGRFDGGLIDDNDIVSVNLVLRGLQNSLLGTVLDFENSVLFDASGTDQMMDWKTDGEINFFDTNLEGSGSLTFGQVNTDSIYEINGINQYLDLANGAILDGTSIVIDLLSQQILNPDTDVILDWSVTGVANFGDTNITTSGYISSTGVENSGGFKLGPGEELVMEWDAGSNLIQIDGLVDDDMRLSSGDFIFNVLDGSFGGNIIFQNRATKMFFYVLERDQDQMAMLIDRDADLNFILANENSFNKNFDRQRVVNSGDDTHFYIFSGTDPNSDNTQWLRLYHNKTNAVIDTGKGGIDFVATDITTSGQINATVFNFSGTLSASSGVINQNGSTFIHTFGTGNLFIGKNAGNFGLTTQNRNVGIGENALASLTSTGGNNVALGFGALDSLTTASQNFGLGTSALGQCTTCGSNVAIGTFSLVTLNSGPNNVCIGRNSCVDLDLSSSSNIGIGAFTLDSNAPTDNVDFNVVIGDNAAGSFVSATAPKRNTLIGTRAGEGLAGDDNIYIGFNAGRSRQGSSELMIDVTNRNDTLIFGNFNTRILKINGDLNVTGDFTITQNLTTSDGGKLWSNATCTFLSSPNGGTVLEVCDP